jgi:hypothetical protein
MLDSYLEDKSDEPLFRKYLTGQNDLLVKISAAIALVNILEEEVDATPIEYILKQLPKVIELDLSPYEFPWNDGELLGYISEVIKFSAIQSPEMVVPDLAKILLKLKGLQALNLVYSLLWIVFPELPEQGVWTLKLLDKFQKLVLKVLAENTDLWNDEEIDIDNIVELLKEYKLPTTQAALKKLLQLGSK